MLISENKNVSSSFIDLNKNIEGRGTQGFPAKGTRKHCRTSGYFIPHSENDFNQDDVSMYVMTRFWKTMFFNVPLQYTTPLKDHLNDHTYIFTY